MASAGLPFRSRPRLLTSPPFPIGSLPDRDIKPQNLLIHPTTGVLKLIDFGSAKILVPGEPNVSYICSRYYRAPELIFGATNYTAAIDVWSTGCVMAELMLGQPLFPGESGIDQLVEIIKVLGTPTREQIKTMNPNVRPPPPPSSRSDCYSFHHADPSLCLSPPARLQYMEHKFPQIRPHPFSKVFRPRSGFPSALFSFPPGFPRCVLSLTPPSSSILLPTAAVRPSKQPMPTPSRSSSNSSNTRPATG